MSGLIPVVVNNQGAFVAIAIRIGEDILVYRTVIVPEIIEQKVLALCEEIAGL